MGWLFTSGQSRTDLIQRRIAPWANNGHKGETLKHSAVGNVLWTVRRNTDPDGKSELWIGCDLMSSDRSYGWGYKDMEESMGPCEVSCPLRFLDMVPLRECNATCPKNGHGHIWARDWRVKVRQYHDRRASAC